MEWIICLVISMVVLLSALVFAAVRHKSKYKSGRLLDPWKIMFIGVAISAFVLFIPIYINTMKNTDCGPIEPFMIAVHNMIRLFVVDGEFDYITNNMVGISVELYHWYSILFSVLFVFAPVLTFGFVMSFFKNISAVLSYRTHFKRNVFIFSELNEKSLALAEYLQKKDKKRFFVFTDVFEKTEEKTYEMVEKARELGAICFKKDMVTVNFSFHSKNSEINFFTIGENYSENIGQALKIIEKYKYRENTNLYVFSTQIESEMLLSNAFNSQKKDEEKKDEPIKIKVRRVNEVQSLIFRNLY